MINEQLNRYLKRIGYETVTEPTLEALKNLQRRHALTFPFENLNPLLDIPVLLDTDTLYRKMVEDDRGGYCYEQNILFLEVLKALGYNARGLTGRVFEKGKKLLRRSHMLVLVEIENRKYISDVGFGSAASSVPLLLKTDEVQRTPSGEYRLISDENDEGFITQVSYNGNWRSLYYFDLLVQTFQDFEMGNWFTSENPAANFKNNLMFSFRDENCRYTIDNNTFSIYYPDGTSQKKIINTTQELREIMTGVFKISLHNLPGLDKKLQELIDG